MFEAGYPQIVSLPSALAAYRLVFTELAGLRPRRGGGRRP
jgi:hypothetical protein